MAHISLSHNPYLIKTIITVDDVAITGGPLHELVENKRLQMWLEKIFNHLVDYCNCGELDVAFQGTVADFNDIELAAKAFSSESGVSIRLTHLAGGEVDPDKKITALRELFNEATKGPIEEFHDEELKREFERALKPEFEVSVIATMSAGKSTLINAIIGEDLLPAKNEACTATLTYISDYDGMDHFIGRAFNEKEVAQSDWIRITPELLEGWNREHIAKVEIQGDIPMIKTDNVRLVLADTPGPNNSRTDSHHRCTMGMIKNEQKPMILYVLNATQLSTNDDSALLKAVSLEMSKGGKQSHDRFIFAVNKIDQFDPEKESIPNALEKVRTYLEEHGIHNPNIYPASALITKLIRKKRKGADLSRQERHDLIGCTELFVEEEAMHLLQYNKQASPSVKREILKRIAEAERKGDKEELAMLHSGVPVIEESIQEYLRKYALPAKLYDAKASFGFILEKRATLSRIDDELRKSTAEREAIHEQMQHIQNRIRRGEEAGAFKARLINLKWKKSKEYEACIRPLEISVAKQINQLQDKVGNEEVSPAIAQNILRGIEQDARMVTVELQQELEKAVKRETVAAMEQIRLEYQKYVQELLGGAENISKSMMEFKSAAIMLPSSESLVRKYAETRRVAIGSHVESEWCWNPFTLFRKKRTVTDYENREIVKMSDISQELADELRKSFFSNFDKAEQYTSGMVSEIRDEFLKHMEGMDATIQKMVDEMANKTASSESLEKAIHENDVKRAWLDKFQLRLDSVLSINGGDDV